MFSVALATSRGSTPYRYTIAAVGLCAFVFRWCADECCHMPVVTDSAIMAMMANSVAPVGPAEFRPRS